jgi:hypothetical protein
MVNICKSLINVVNRDQAKGADRLDPKKGTWLDQDLPSYPDADEKATGGQARPTSSWYGCGTWKPRRSPEKERHP